MKKQDYDKIAAVEQAIAEKYGTETVQNPRGNWDETKEKEYLQHRWDKIWKNIKILLYVDTPISLIIRADVVRFAIRLQKNQWTMCVSSNLSVATNVIFNLLKTEKRDG